MFRKLILFLFLLALLLYFISAFPKATTLPLLNESLASIKKEDRILILAPHPDDETIGCAGIIQEAKRQGAQVEVVYLTNGDHNEFAFIVYEKRITLRKTEFIHMGEVRRREAIKAMKLLGLSENNLIFLGYPDFGTFEIFYEFWQTKKPFKHLLTRIAKVPYKRSISFGQPYVGESILSDLRRIIFSYKPNKIFVSHPQDANGDHKALYLFLQVTLQDLRKIIPPPKVYPYLVHCSRWPLPRNYHPELTLEPPKQCLNTRINWLRFNLTEGQLDKKYRAILCYKSQTESSAFYLLSFARKNELFGDYPNIVLLKGDLTKPVEDKNQVSYSLTDDSLLIRIKKIKEGTYCRLATTIFLFGYSYKTPFSRMPKIRIISKFKEFKVFDAGKMINPEGMTLDITLKELILKVPLKILGEPDFILSSVKAYTGCLPEQITGFRKINIIRRN